MISEWNIQMFFHVLSGFTNAWGGWKPPEWFAGLGPTIKNFFLTFDGLGVWAPWDVIGTAVAAVLTTYVVCLTVKIVLRILSYVPFVGGAG